MNLEKLISIIFFFVCLVILWWMFYPYNPLTIKEPMKILNEGKTLKEGSVVELELEFTKRTRVKPLISTWVLDGVEYKLSEETASNPPGETIKPIGFIFPKGLNVDGRKWRVKKECCYKMNPIREPICITYYSEEFTVTK